MKLETIKILPDGEFRRILGQLIGKCGSQRAAAKKMGMTQPTLANLISGNANPGRKSLDYFGLERKVVYLPKTKEKKSV